MLYAATVETWICDQISGEIEWTAVLPGKNRDWRQHPAIKSIFAACDGGIRRLQDWMGKSSGAVNKGGRHPSLPTGVGEPPRTAPRRGREAGHAVLRPFPRTQMSRQTAPCAPGSSRWTYLASTACAAQSCRRIGYGRVNQTYQSSRWWKC